MVNLRKNFWPLALGLISSVFFLFIVRYQNRLGFFVALFLWLAVLIFVALKPRPARVERRAILPILLATVLAFVSLGSILEWMILNYFFTGLIGLEVMLLFQSVSGQGDFWRLSQKPYRRIMVLIWSFNVFSFITTIFALSLFFPGIPFWLLTIIGGFIFGFISVMIWRMYFQLRPEQGLAWIFLMAFLMMELIWVMHFLPFGYLVSGFFLTWIWYVLQLLARFHFAATGIVWRRQILFLAINAILFFLILLFFVRWV